MLKILFFYGKDGQSKIQEEFLNNIEILLKRKVEIKRINSEKDKENLQKYGINQTPTIIIEKAGKVTDKFVGFTQELFLKRAIEKNLTK